MRYLDGELPPEERERVDAELVGSTELQREVAIFRALKTDFQDLSFDPRAARTSVWGQVHSHLTRPIGWLLVIAGAALWSAYGVFVFATSAINPWEKLATGAIAIGVLMLLASVIWERYRQLETDPYRDIYR